MKTTKVGWGPLASDIWAAQEVFRRKKAAEELLLGHQADLLERIKNLNTVRIQRILHLLREEDEAICLLHRKVLKILDVERWLIPKRDIVILRMVKFWTETYRVDDSDPEHQTMSSQYDTTACSTCSHIVTNGTFREDSSCRPASHTLMRGVRPLALTADELYTPDIIDIVSMWYGMPVVTMENLASL